MSPAKAQKRGAALLVKQFFNCENREVMDLTKEQRIQLGSAIARQQGLTQDDLEFEMVPY